MSVAPVQTDSPPRGPVRSALAWRRLDFLLIAVLALLAFVVRWPSLWLVPRFTDETLEVLHSLAIVRDGTRPLTNYDSYYGALYNYLIALALLLSGESALAPRVVVLIAGILTVVATYLLGVQVGRQLFSDDPIAARLVGLLAAGLLATNGPHVVVNSHVAWSNCLTPLLTTLAFWALLRGDRTLRGRDESRPYRRGEGERDSPSPRRRGGWGVRSASLGWGVRFSLPLAGLLLGLALQTHPLVVTMLPGIALAVLLRDWRIVRTPWPWLAIVAFLLGYANVLAYNAEQGFESLRSAQRMQAEYAQDQQAATGYGSIVLSMLLLLARILGGAVDRRDAVTSYLLDPSVFSVVGLSLLGLGVLVRRRIWLPALVTLSFLTILPAVNPKFQTLLTTRYLMPIVPLLFVCAALSVVWAAGQVSQRWPGSRRRPRLVALFLGLLLVALPTSSLDRYYAEIYERTDTNERILRLMGEIEAARRPGEVVVFDESIGAELPDTGVTEMRGLEYLLTFARVPSRAVRPTPGRLQDSFEGQPTVLAILNARDAQAAESRVRVEPLDPRPPVETGRMFDYRLYRLSPGRG